MNTRLGRVLLASRRPPTGLVSGQTSSSPNSACHSARGLVARQSQASSRLARRQKPLRTYVTNLSDRTRGHSEASRTGSGATPQGLKHSAQGWRSSAYPGSLSPRPNPVRVEAHGIFSVQLEPLQGSLYALQIQDRRWRANPGLSACHPYRGLCKSAFRIPEGFQNPSRWLRPAGRHHRLGLKSVPTPAGVAERVATNICLLNGSITPAGVWAFFYSIPVVIARSGLNHRLRCGKAFGLFRGTFAEVLLQDAQSEFQGMQRGCNAAEVPTA